MILQAISTVVSFLFHPLLVPTYAFFLIGAFYPENYAQLAEQDQTMLLVIIFLNTFAFPAFALVVLRLLGFAKSLHLQTNKERIIPFIIIGTLYFGCYWFLRQKGFGVMTNNLMLGASLAVFISFFFNIFYRISTHAVGMGGMVGLMLILVLLSGYNLEVPLMISILVAGLVGSARIVAAKHRPNDIFSGYMVGLMSQLIAFQLL